MKQVYHVADAMLCSLGKDSQSVFEAVTAGQSGIRSRSFDTGLTYPVSMLSAAQEQMLAAKYGPDYSRFEQMCLFVAACAIEQSNIDAASEACLFILSTTKGNVTQIGQEAVAESIPLHYSAKKIGQYFNNPNPVSVVSVACISGVAAQIMAKRLLESDHYKYAIIIGCDELSPFILAGFHSFQALSATPCRPFDANRSGLNLGEAAVCMVLSNEQAAASGEGILEGGAISNDANHLSGPSKTGEELGVAIRQAMAEAGKSPEAIGFVSAHGTATNYNDEMEAKAIHHAGIKAPVNSLKPYFGHTLGASGLLETLISLKAMNAGLLLPTLHFETSNVSVPVSIIKEISHKEISNFVKTAAGFGGCNAAVLWSKYNLQHDSEN
ncbi:MAG: beta-ketoacyl synthase [Sphingobacteriales bacterium]|nr:MAG: beta-ketoacyl synthase [Sphingobacteriales bacterium]